jgi:hypothetical protein
MAAIATVSTALGTDVEEYMKLVGGVPLHGGVR